MSQMDAVDKIPFMTYDIALDDGYVLGLGHPSLESERSIWHWLTMDYDRQQLYPSLLIADGHVNFNLPTMPDGFTPFQTLSNQTWAFNVTAADGQWSKTIIDPATETHVNQ